MKESSIDLSTFKKAQKDMIAKNAASWDEYYGRRSQERIKEYSLEEINRILESGTIEEQQKLSRNFYNKGGFYKRILIYYATILKYCGLLTPHAASGKKLSTSHIQKRYFNALEYVDRLGIPELCTRISVRALVDGCYYGIIQTMDKNEFTIIDLPSKYCRSRYKDSHGNDVIEFDVSYFYEIVSGVQREKALNSFPKVISAWFRKYDASKVNSAWVIIPTEVGICFPFFEDERPLFLSVIPATIQYDDAVDTERERELEEIRKIIVQKVPHLNDGQLLFEPEEAVEMHAGAVGMMKGNKNLSILTTYTDVDAITSRTSTENASNYLERMLQNTYSKAGISSQLFASTNSQTVGTSITNAMSLMMVLGNKYSRFITFIINSIFANSNVSFSYDILPVSYYNQSEYIEDSLKLAQFGYSFLLPSIGLGLSQRSLMGIKELENDVLKLNEVLIPLSSSYTQSGSAEKPEEKEQTEDGEDGEVEETKEVKKTKVVEQGKPGAPKKKLEDKADKTIQNENAQDNQGGSS